MAAEAGAVGSGASASAPASADAGAGAGAPEPADSAELETLRALARQARSVPLPVALTSTVIAAIVARGVPAAWVLAWLAAVLAMQAVRRVVLPRLAADASRPAAERLRAAARLSLANGCVHASVALALPWLDAAQAAVVTMVFVGLCAGTVGTSAGHRGAFAGFVGPVLSMLALQWLLHDSGTLPAWTRAGIAVLIVLLFGLLWRMAADLSAALVETFEIRRRERALRGDLVDLNGRLQAALEHAESSNRAKTRFLASASHDLRQPLHALLLFTAALSVRRLDPKSQEIAQRIDDATQALGHELDTLLDVSKLDAGVVRVNVEPLDPADVVGRVVETLSPVGERKRLAVRCDAVPGLRVATDRTLLERVVRNLVDNAIKYTDEGTVTVSVRRAQASVEIAVADTGRGIPAEERERIFEEFYQLGNPERDRQRGLGLGLAIVRRLVDLLGGRLRVDSEVGRGSTFTLALPAAGADAGPRPRVETVARRGLAGLHLLVIDDEASVRLGTRLLLEGLGCRVTAVGGTAEALEAAAADRPDVVLADLRLRGEDSGIVAVERLRARHPGLPALLISGDTDPDRLREAERAGLPLLHKPVPAEALARAIGDALPGGVGECAG
jgi:signal transduction histidine kinase